LWVVLAQPVCRPERSIGLAVLLSAISLRLAHGAVSGCGVHLRRGHGGCVNSQFQASAEGEGAEEGAVDTMTMTRPGLLDLMWFELAAHAVVQVRAVVCGCRGVRSEPASVMHSARVLRSLLHTAPRVEYSLVESWCSAQSRQPPSPHPPLSQSQSTAVGLPLQHTTHTHSPFSRSAPTRKQSHSRELTARTDEGVWQLLTELSDEDAADVSMALGPWTVSGTSRAAKGVPTEKEVTVECVVCPP